VLRTNRFAGAKDLVERFCTVPADTVCLVVGNEHDVPPAERIGDHSEGKRRGIRLPMVTKTVGVGHMGANNLPVNFHCLIQRDAIQPAGIPVTRDCLLYRSLDIQLLVS